MEECRQPSARLVVMASGNGSNLQAILDASAEGSLTDRARVVAVVSDRSDSRALARATEAGIASLHVGAEPDQDRTEYDRRLAEIVAGFEPDLVVLAGWMRILTTEFISRFADKIINLHPAKPGELAGTRAIERAWQEALAGERTETGVMVHRVPDEGVDTGPVLASETIPIELDDTLDVLTERIRRVEHRLLVDTIRALCAQPKEITA
ncbi:MAG: phosphoribosylglycinamide formyltransferase [Ilumatobacteraceae bacterium]